MAYDPSYTDCRDDDLKSGVEPNLSCGNGLGQVMGMCSPV